MAKKLINTSHIEGYIYEHDLKKNTSKKNPGVEYIKGTLSIATDEDMLNVVKINFRYLTPLTKSNKPNATYNTLLNIIEGRIGTVADNGKENAGKVRIDSALGLNEWYNPQSNFKELISVKINEGGFVHALQTLGEENTRATFETDVLINKVIHQESDPEKNLPERALVKGYIFNFRDEIFPWDFVVTSPAGISYFETLGVSDKRPIFTRVRGEQVSKIIVKTIEEDGAFDGPAVREVRDTQKEFRITWASPAPYEWDSEETLLASEVAEKMAARETSLAEIKKNQLDYAAQKSPAPTPAPGAASPASDDYDF